MNDYPSRDDQRMRELLHDAVSDVDPRDSLGAIRRRTAGAGGSRRAWVWGVGGAVLATAAIIAAFALVGGGPATAPPDDQAAGPPSPSTAATPTHEASPTPSESPTDTSAPVSVLPVYYVGDTSRGPRLYREFRAGTVPASAAVRAAVEQAVSGSPDDPDYRSPWPRGTHVRSASYDGDIITVDLESAGTPSGLHDRPAGMTEDEAALALQQVMYTAQGALQQGRPGVQFLLDGQHTDTVLGEPASEPLAQGEAIDVLAQVWIIDPAEGARVPTSFEVSGLAAAFEANVQWELKQGDTVVKRGFTTAEECCTMAPYSFTVKASPGRYTLVVHDSDPSGGEGFAPWEDTKNLTVVP